MMSNLFSTFDPSTNMNLSLNWLSITVGVFLLPNLFWLIPNRMFMFMHMIYTLLYNEYKTILNKSYFGMTMMLNSLFIFILMNNLMGLLPYIFTSSSHMVFNLTLSLPLWMSIMLFGWKNKSEEMFAHLIPAGTPGMLMPFMVLIENISNLIRPGSLAVRLTANMIAGHLLMTLLGNNMTSINVSMFFIFPIQVILMSFETAVSIIQAYVFSVLMSLYSKEVIYE